MALVPLVIGWLTDSGLFGGRVRRAGDLAALMRSGMAQEPVLQAHVLPSSFRGGDPSAAAGVFIQPLFRGVTVILTYPGEELTAPRDSDALELLVVATMREIAGRAGEGTPGVFRFVAGQILTMQGGTIVYRLDFSITDQLRIQR